MGGVVGSRAVGDGVVGDGVVSGAVADDGVVVMGEEVLSIQKLVSITSIQNFTIYACVSDSSQGPNKLKRASEIGCSTPLRGTHCFRLGFMHMQDIFGYQVYLIICTMVVNSDQSDCSIGGV